MAYLDNVNALNVNSLDGSAREASPGGMPPPAPPTPVVDAAPHVLDAYGNQLNEDSVSNLSAGGAVTLAQVGGKPGISMGFISSAAGS